MVLAAADLTAEDWLCRQTSMQPEILPTISDPGFTKAEVCAEHINVSAAV